MGWGGGVWVGTAHQTRALERSVTYQIANQKEQNAKPNSKKNTKFRMASWALCIGILIVLCVLLILAMEIETVCS